jgi:hypothetical protein
MKGLSFTRTIGCCALACALTAAPAAAAVSTANSGVVASTAGARVESRGSVSGTVSTLNGWSFIVQTAGRRIGVVNALANAATRITNQNTPYVYGGGHASAGNASIGIPGPGYNGKRVGFDCSGSVAAVLVGGGLWPAGSGVPNDAGIISELRGERLIVPGVGKGPVEVTLYDNPGVHIFMNIDGRFFGTSDGGGGGDAKGGAGWLYDGAPDASTSQYKPYHFIASVLKGSTSSGQSVGFELSEAGSVVGGLLSGEKVKVSYEEMTSGTMIATALTYPGSTTTTGTVGSIAANGSSFTIETSNGATLTFSTASAPQLLDDVAAGDTVEVNYTKVRSTLAAHTVTVTATPVPTTGTPPGTGTGASGGSGWGGWGGGS